MLQTKSRLALLDMIVTFKGFLGSSYSIQFKALNPNLSPNPGTDTSFHVKIIISHRFVKLMRL